MTGKALTLKICQEELVKVEEGKNRRRKLRLGF